MARVPTIFVVRPGFDELDMYRLFLEAQGFSLIAVKTAEAALDRAREVGCDRVPVKPCHLDVLRWAIREVLLESIA